jgi:hypothetical protein
MLAKIISAGALTLLLSGGVLADQAHKIYAGHSNSAHPRQNLQLNAASGSTGSTLHSQRGATSQHNPYASHRNSPTQRHAADPAPYGYRWVQ